MADMRLVIMGAAGRMGRMLVRTIGEIPGVAVGAALERPGSDALGKDAGTLAGLSPIGVPIRDDPLQAVVDADGIAQTEADHFGKCPGCVSMVIQRSSVKASIPALPPNRP